MLSLGENIKQTNAKIAELDELIRVGETNTATQRDNYEKARLDNETKAFINSRIDDFIQVNLNNICSVNIDNQKWETIKNLLKEFKEALNASNISANEQETKLGQFQEVVNKHKQERENQINLKKSYQLQLKVDIEERRRRLAEDEAMINDLL